MALLIKLFVFAFVGTAVIDSTNDTVCFWGRDGNINVRMNGEYTLDGTSSVTGKPYYAMRVDSSLSCNDIMYMYFRDSAWRFGENLDEDGYNAYCNDDSNTSNPENCGVWSSGGSDDSDISVSYGSCPAWTCDEIRTDLASDNPCVGPFDTAVSGADNALSYYNSLYGYNVYLYFNPSFFRYLCTDTYDLTCSFTESDTNLYVFSDQGYVTTTGDVSWQNWTITGSTDIGVRCYTEPPTSPPTQQPTNATGAPTTGTPTTDTPTTDSPTTDSPTTWSPTMEGDTRTPTEPPTVASPTNDPTTTSPTDDPTTEKPTDDPTTASPTDDPTTASPTDSPSTSSSVAPPTADFGNTLSFCLALVLSFIMTSLKL